MVDTSLVMNRRRDGEKDIRVDELDSDGDAEMAGGIMFDLADKESKKSSVKGWTCKPCTALYCPAQGRTG